ncbi:MAG: MBL fold metallo-hydrolase [Candidatus Eremiobacteraeota bacterium]|nr:MBL fold metallo-hydrolase [Candidatus Eremiobacteraeota bacterium]
MDVADRYGMRIEAVISTHVHADHRSGNRELVARTGAAGYFHASADVRYPFAPLADGAEISLGNVVIRVLHTPGHTPESMSLLITDRSRAPEPWMVLTGDTLFVGDVGRPDFGGEDAGRALHASLQRLLALSDYVEVYPAHISGSPCGRAMSGKPSSTIGFERRHNAALQHADRDAFVAALFEGLPKKPPGFTDMIATNRAG